MRLTAAAVQLKPVRVPSVLAELKTDESLGRVEVWLRSHLITHNPTNPPSQSTLHTIHTFPAKFSFFPLNTDERKLVDLCLVARLNLEQVEVGQPRALRYLVCVYAAAAERFRLSSPVRGGEMG